MSAEARDPLHGDEAMKALSVAAVVGLVYGAACASGSNCALRAAVQRLRLPRKKAIGFVRSPNDAEEMVYRSASLARESSDDLTIVVTFALLGLALSLLAVGPGGLIDAEYMADLLLLF
jgi:hypothetical protein